jgi:hypothetical protein
VIGKTGNVVPWDAKSAVVEFVSPDGASPGATAWAELRFKRPRRFFQTLGNPDESARFSSGSNASRSTAGRMALSFWVRPVLKSGGARKSVRRGRGKVDLRLAARKGGNGKWRWLSAKLAEGEWSRVELPVSGVNDFPDVLRVLPPGLPSKPRGRRHTAFSVSYEFNGLAALGTRRNGLRGTRLVARPGVRRPPPGEEGGTGLKKRGSRIEERSVSVLLIFGTPGGRFECRRVLAGVAKMRSAVKLVAFKCSRSAWKREAGVFEVVGVFPGSRTVLSGGKKEAEAPERNGKTDGSGSKTRFKTTSQDEVERLLTAKERVALSSGEVACVAIRLEYLR